MKDFDKRLSALEGRHSPRFLVHLVGPDDPEPQKATANDIVIRLVGRKPAAVVGQFENSHVPINPSPRNVA